MARLDPTGVSRILSYIKTWVTTALGGKANSSHNHTKSQITDFPTIPSNTSQLTNDSGYITSSGSCNYANSAGSAGSATTAEAVSTSVADGSVKDVVYAYMAGSDAFRIRCGGSGDNGYVEIATSDNGNEPIYVRQYNIDGGNIGDFTTIARTLTLLDGSGNTQFPGTVTASTFSGNLTGNCSGSAGSVAWSNVTGKPTIPTNTNQLTNGAGFITSSGSCNYANSAGYVQGNNNSANAANALLRSGSGRTDSSPEGDTWIFLDEAGGTSTPWGFKHNQGANTIGFYGRGTETSSINLSNGYFSGSCNYANSSGNADTLDGYHHDSFPKTSAALFTVNGLGTPGWSKIGTGEGGSCIQVKTTDNTYPSICFHRSGHSHCVLAESGGQLGTMQQGGSFNHLITSANIGSQSVNYANSAGSAGSVAWSNVSGRPTTLSQFTNDSEFWSPGGGKWNPNANISLTASGSNQEWSFDIRQNGNSGCYWHVWSDVHGSMLRVDADNGAVRVPKNIFYLGSYKVYVG